MKRIRLLLWLTCLTLFSTTFGQNEKFKALFIYNFTSYIDWPTAPSGSFIITVIGDSPIYGELESISKVKKINGLPIELKKAGSAAEIGKTNMVFVPNNKKKALPDIEQTLSGKPILIISDGASNGFGINFTEADQKLSFQISRSNIDAHKLKVSSSLYSLGVAVN